MSRSFNTNVKYNSKVYHVQTEVYQDNIVTNVFDGGRVVFSEKKPFTDFKASISQHKNVEQVIQKGSFKNND